MKKIFRLAAFTAIAFLFHLLSKAQDASFSWVNRIGEAGEDGGNSITVDASGNVYTTGKLNDNAFISKFDSTGILVWTRQMAGSSSLGVSITTDVSGNVLTTGTFIGMVDFDPGPATFNLLAGSNDLFIIKLDVAGNLIWAKRIGGTIFYQNVFVSSITTDSQGNVYTTGSSNGPSIDFDPGQDVYAFSTANYWEEIFVSKLDVNGNFVWAKKMQSLPFGGGPEAANGSWALSISVDNTGNVYTTGRFSLQVDFDPGPGVFYLYHTANWCDAFISKLNSQGNFVWAKQLKSKALDASVAGSSVILGAAGSLYIAGYFGDSVDFDPGPGTWYFDNTYGNYILTLDAAGNFISVNQFGGASVFNAITLDAARNIFAIGSFGDTTDFDPGIGAVYLFPLEVDIFISKSDSAGNLIWVKQLGGSEADYGNSIARDATGNIYTTGRFRNRVDFDPSSSVYELTSAGWDDVFIHKMAPCVNPSAILSQPIDQQACPGTNVTFAISTINVLTYQWQLSTNGGITFNDIIGATGSSYTLTSVTTTQNGHYFRCRLTGECMPTYTTAAVLTTTTFISAQPQVASLCIGSDHTFNITATGVNITYQWQLSTDGGNLYNDIPGATLSAYTLASVALIQNGYYYRCRVIDGCDISFFSNPAIISVASRVEVISQPVDIELCSGSSTSFSVSGLSNQTVIYKWHLSKDGGTTYQPISNGGIYSGATTSTLTIRGVNSDVNDHRYRCNLSNASCIIPTISNAATLTVHELPTIGLKAVPHISLTPGQTTMLIATPSPSSGGILSTTWVHNNSILPATGITVTVNVEQLGTYLVKIQERWPGNFVCSNNSDPVIIYGRPTEKLYIFPNPSVGQFSISYYNDGGIATHRNIKVYDEKGAKVYDANFNVTGPYSLLNIDISSRPAGFYSVMIADTNGKKLAVGKIIVY